MIYGFQWMVKSEERWKEREGQKGSTSKGQRKPDQGMRVRKRKTVGVSKF